MSQNLVSISLHTVFLSFHFSDAAVPDTDRASVQRAAPRVKKAIVGWSESFNKANVWHEQEEILFSNKNIRYTLRIRLALTGR